MAFKKSWVESSQFFSTQSHLTPIFTLGSAPHIAFIHVESTWPFWWSKRPPFSPQKLYLGGFLLAGHRATLHTGLPTLAKLLGLFEKAEIIQMGWLEGFQLAFFFKGP